MRCKPFPGVVLAAALSACSAQPELLNSDRIRQRFGSHGVELLHQDVFLATIVEVHHPDHLIEADLLQLYLDDTRTEFDAAALARFVELVMN